MQPCFQNTREANHRAGKKWWCLQVGCRDGQAVGSSTHALFSLSVPALLMVIIIHLKCLHLLKNTYSGIRLVASAGIIPKVYKVQGCLQILYKER